MNRWALAPAHTEMVLSRARNLHERVRPKRLRAPSLDALNFLVADVRGALGPYVIVYLVADQHWAMAAVGFVMTLGGWLGLAMQTPMGAILDSTQRKQSLLVVSLIVLGLGAITIAVVPSFWPVLIAVAMMQIVSGVFDPAIAALTVGLFGRDMLARRMGRNAAFGRAGNFVVAAMAAALGSAISPRTVFIQVPVMAFFACIAVLTIPNQAIDLRRARGLHAEEKNGRDPASWKSLLTSRTVLVFGLCVLLFQFAFAPLLTLAGQMLTLAGHGPSTLMISACIMAAQAGMLPAAVAVGYVADRLGHRWLLLIAFGILPVQAGLMALGDSPYWLIGLQVFGGIGAGLLTTLTPLLLADSTAGTGRYNLSQGFVATLSSVGAASSAFAAEYVVGRFGYSPAFCSCAFIAGIGFLVLWFGLPATGAEASTK